MSDTGTFLDDDEDLESATKTEEYFALKKLKLLDRKLSAAALYLYLLEHSHPSLKSVFSMSISADRQFTITYLHEVMVQINVTFDKWILIFAFPNRTALTSRKSGLS